MIKRNASILLLASTLLMLPAAATAKEAQVTKTTASKGGAVNAAALVDRYKTLAGSEANAKSLVNGLRTQSEVVLVGPSTTPPKSCIPGRPCNGGGTETVTFTPSTDPMGWGNVDIALALMEADLKDKNVTSVKPAHIKAALMGGSAGGVTFQGILALRAAGHGWGDIAKQLNFELR
jgi:hypothetical protein